MIIWILIIQSGHNFTQVMKNLTRRVDGTPTSEVTPVTTLSLVDPYTWPWSPKGQGHIWPWKCKCQGHGQGQSHWSHLWPGVQSICLLFVLWQSDPFWLRYSKFHIWPWKLKVKVMTKVTSDGHIWGLGFNQCLLFVLWQSDHFWQRYEKFYIWPWNFKVKVMVTVKADGDIWGLEFNRCVCFSFRGNRTIFGWDIANSILDLENLRSRSQQKSTKI